MSNREEIEREARQRITAYYEELKQFVSVSWVSPGEPIPRPKRVFDAAAIEEIKKAERKLDKLRQEMNEACNQLYEAYH